MEKQLRNALLELKSAEKIISVLREDLKCNIMGLTADHHFSAPSSEPCGSDCEVSDHKQINENWTWKMATTDRHVEVVSRFK